MIITRKLTKRMQDEHVAFVDEYFSEENVNLGWVTDPDGMCTKVYTVPRQYVNTQINADGSITHSITKD